MRTTHITKSRSWAAYHTVCWWALLKFAAKPLYWLLYGRGHRLTHKTWEWVQDSLGYHLKSKNLSQHLRRTGEIYEKGNS